MQTCRRCDGDGDAVVADEMKEMEVETCALMMKNGRELP